MTEARLRRAAAVFGLFVALSGAVSCVYFNTYYNAEKFFRQAEKARREAEKQDARGNRATGGRGRAGASGKYVALYDRAVAKASIVLEKYPDSELVDDAMFLAGRALYWQQDYHYAAQSFRDLEVNFPESEYYDLARLWRGRCLEAMGSPDDARALFSALVQERSAEGDRAGLRLGEMAAAAGELREAIGHFDNTLAVFPGTRLAAQLWLQIGEAHVALGGTAHLDTALVAYDRTLKASPADSVEYRARYNRGRVLYLQGRPDGALATYQALLTEGRFRAWEGETRLLIGDYYRERGQLDEALGQFVRVRDDFPLTDVSAMALYQTGLLYLQSHGDRERAYEYFSEVNREQRGSVADSLAGEMLQTFDALDLLILDIYAADSTAAALQLGTWAVTGEVDEEGGGGLVEAAVDSIASVFADTSVGDTNIGETSVIAAATVATLDSAIIDDAAAEAATDTVAADMDVATDNVAADMDVATDTVAADMDVATDTVAAADPASIEPAETDAIATRAEPKAQKMPPALAGYIAAADEEGRWVPLIGRPPEPEDDGDAAANNQRRRQRRPARRPSGREAPTLEENLFAAAEIHRDRLGLPDSAVVFYEAVVERLPQSLQVPRALYSLTFIHAEQRRDREAARPYLERLLADYSVTAHANAARLLYDLPPEGTAEDEAAEVFREIEVMRFEQPEAASQWIPLFDDLAAHYPLTETAVRAAYLAAWATENALGDSVAAAARYDSVASRYPASKFAELIADRRRVQRAGLLAKLERELKKLSQGVGPGERLVIICVEPDSSDSVSLSRRYLGFAVRAHRHNELQRAEELYQLSLDEQQGRNGNALAGLGDVAWRQDYYDLAIEKMREALKERATSLLPAYRLFAYHVQEGQVDSANKYMRMIARLDRENPSAIELAERFPTIATAEPEPVDLASLESIDLEPSDETLRLDPGLFGIVEPPMVRSSQAPQYPAGMEDSTSVVIDVLVTREGLPEQVDVFSGEEPFASAAIAAVEAYLFYPAEDRGERPLPVWVEVAIPFSPSLRQQASDATVAEADTLSPVPAADSTGSATGSVLPAGQLDVAGDVADEAAGDAEAVE